jgi:hypothetical protein
MFKHFYGCVKYEKETEAKPQHTFARAQQKGTNTGTTASWHQASNYIPMTASWEVPISDMMHCVDRRPTDLAKAALDNNNISYAR